jgi:hypothetical protein
MNEQLDLTQIIFANLTSIYTDFTVSHNVVGMSMDFLAAQAFVFFVGGFQTSSTTMTFSLYELSLHPEIQDRVREEIDDVLKKHDGKITYEAIQEMEYLDKVVAGKAHYWKNVYLLLPIVLSKKTEHMQ